MLPASATAVSIMATLSDISEGEEELAVTADGAASFGILPEHLRMRGGPPSHERDAQDADCSAPPEAVKRCRSPGSNNAVPWRPSAPRAAILSSRLDHGA
jgi:hypothetical protein